MNIIVFVDLYFFFRWSYI